MRILILCSSLTIILSCTEATWASQRGAPAITAERQRQMDEAWRHVMALHVNPADPVATDGLFRLRHISTGGMIALIGGVVETWKSREYRQDYASALALRGPVRRGGQWVQPLALPMNPTERAIVAMCGILARIGDPAALSAIGDVMSYGLSINAHAHDEVLRAYTTLARKKMVGR
jgi:hypothetical protein